MALCRNIKACLIFTVLLFLTILAPSGFLSAAEEEDSPRIRIIASKNPKRGFKSGDDVNNACMLYNNDVDECQTHRQCTALPLDENDILCLSKAYVAAIISAVATGDVKLFPTKNVKRRCDDASNGAACKRTRGCEVFRFKDKEICAPKEGGYELNKQDLDITIFESTNRIQVNGGIEHLSVLDSSEARDQWNIFGGFLASGNSPFYQLAGVSYKIGNVFESGIGSKITNDEISLGMTQEREIDNSVVVGIPFLAYSTSK